MGTERTGGAPEAAEESPTAVIPAGEEPGPVDVESAARLRQRLGPYRLLDVLGQGGMALVYEAEAPSGRHVALKVLHESPFLPEGMLARFRREAEAVKRLGTHPNIVEVYDTGKAGRNHYIAMRMVAGGRTLAHRMREGLKPVPETIGLGITIASALAHAHEEGIIHRDVKP
ncbi:MAG: serine/threonine protein kinase, partial [Lentisphaeria bacterium]|nr:serine/threonine protein kinase [Lentisphaeria bacterium]